MEIKIPRSELLKQLQLVQGIVERKTTMPILSNVLFEAKKKQLTTTATDLEVGVTSSCPAEVLKEGRVTIHARGLYEIVKELPEELVHLKVKENFWVEIHCSRAEFKIVGLSPDEFPALPKKGEGQQQRLDCATFVEMIEKTAFSMSNDETRYNLNGVYLEYVGEEKTAVLRMVATDGHRLSIAERPATGAWKAISGVILPRKGVQELRRLFEGQDGPFDLWIDGKHAIVSLGNVSLAIRLIDGQFPPYRQVIPKESKRVVAVDRDEIYHALKRVSAMASDRTRGVRLAVSPKNLEVSANTPDIGEAREGLAATYRGESFEVGFNARYFLEALSVIEDPQAVLQLGDDTAPCVMRSELDKGFTHVIMPMRL